MINLREFWYFFNRFPFDEINRFCTLVVWTALNGIFLGHLRNMPSTLNVSMFLFTGLLTALWWSILFSQLKKTLLFNAAIFLEIMFLFITQCSIIVCPPTPDLFPFFHEAQQASLSGCHLSFYGIFSILSLFHTFDI